MQKNKSMSVLAIVAGALIVILVVMAVLFPLVFIRSCERSNEATERERERFFELASAEEKKGYFLFSERSIHSSGEESGPTDGLTDKVNEKFGEDGAVYADIYLDTENAAYDGAGTVYFGGYCRSSGSETKDGIVFSMSLSEGDVQPVFRCAGEAVSVADAAGRYLFFATPSRAVVYDLTSQSEVAVQEAEGNRAVSVSESCAVFSYGTEYSFAKLSPIEGQPSIAVFDPPTMGYFRYVHSGIAYFAQDDGLLGYEIGSDTVYGAEVCREKLNTSIVPGGIVEGESGDYKYIHGITEIALDQAWLCARSDMLSEMEKLTDTLWVRTESIFNAADGHTYLLASVGRRDGGLMDSPQEHWFLYEWLSPEEIVYVCNIDCYAGISAVFAKADG